MRNIFKRSSIILPNSMESMILNNDNDEFLFRYAKTRIKNLKLLRLSNGYVKVFFSNIYNMLLDIRDSFNRVFFYNRNLRK